MSTVNYLLQKESCKNETSTFFLSGYPISGQRTATGYAWVSRINRIYWIHSFIKFESSYLGWEYREGNKPGQLNERSRTRIFSVSDLGSWCSIVPFPFFLSCGNPGSSYRTQQSFFFTKKIKKSFIGIGFTASIQNGMIPLQWMTKLKGIRPGA